MITKKQLEEAKQLAIKYGEFGPYSWSVRLMNNINGYTKEYKECSAKYEIQFNYKFILSMIESLEKAIEVLKFYEVATQRHESAPKQLLRWKGEWVTIDNSKAKELLDQMGNEDEI